MTLSIRLFMKKKATLTVKAIKNRIAEVWRHKLLKKEQDRYEDRLIDKLDEVCSRLVRLRDQNKPCITRWISVCKDWIVNRQCCHTIKRAYYSCRRDLRNLFSGCWSCNVYGGQDHDWMIVAQMIKIHWQDVYDELRNNRSMEKPRYEDMEKLLEERTAQYLELKNNQWKK